MTTKILITLLLPIGSLLAHDIALFPKMDGNSVIVVAKYGHPGDYQAAALQKMLELDAYAPDGRKISMVKEMKLEGSSIIATLEGAGSGTWVMATRYDNGFYVKTAEGRMIATTKMEYPAATTSTHNFKFGKALIVSGKPGAQFSRVVGHRLELIPKVDPFTLKPGDKLPVEVRFEGRPLKGVGVEIGDGATPMKEDDIPRYTTDASGVAMVPIQKGGLQLVAVDHKAPSKYPELAAEDAYSATLTFVLHH